MKSVMKKVLVTLLILVLSTTILYLGFTITAFSSWCSENQISIFFDSDHLTLDKDKIQAIGDTVGNFAQLMEDSLDPSYYEENSDYHSLAEYYDPLGYSVWGYMQSGIVNALTKYLSLSISLGIATAIAYVVITNQKMKPILKFAIGYLGLMLVIPQILWYSYFYRFFGVFRAYLSTPNILYFYIVYTIIIALMYVIYYKQNIKKSKKSDQPIKN